MNNACMTRAVSETCAVPPRVESAGAAPLEVLARLLGYTERELALASNVLSQFAWRHAPNSAHASAPAAEAESSDSGPDRKRAA